MKLTQKEVKKLFYYDFCTGNLYWRVDRGPNKVKGNIAGSLNKSGYIRIKINDSSYSAHRIIWLYVYGKLNENLQIDHKDGNRSNNKLDNLREVTQSINQQNQRRHKIGKSGYLGVYYMPTKNKYKAEINQNGKRIYLGLYSTIEEAILFRKIAEKEYGYHKDHGQLRST